MHKTSRANSVHTKLMDRWRACGIESGDTVVLHSSLKRTLQHLNRKDVYASPSDVLESFLLAVGSGGTLVCPTFNFEFTFGKKFDRLRTPSHMGILGETARLDPRAYRTSHPVYSFAVIGRSSSCFMGKENYSAWGFDSPFAIARKLNGKIAVLDVPDRHSMTYFHYVEEVLEVPFRFHKEFRGEYVDLNGETIVKECSIFVRDIDAGVVPCLDKMGERLWEQGVYKGYRPYEESGLRVAPATTIFDAVSSVIQSGCAEGLLYTIDQNVAKTHKLNWKEQRKRHS